jgi:outer membrane protein TolC
LAGTGNWSRLALDREQVFYAESMLQLARAREQAHARREALIRTLGLWGPRTAITLPERLPDLPDAVDEMQDLEQRAMEQRLDIRLATLELDATARALGLTKATRLVNVLEAGPAQTREGDGPMLNGYELSLDVPIFDWGGARVKRAQAIYTQQMMRVRETAITARSQVREAYIAYRTAYDVAKHYRDEIVPLRKRISDEQLLRYNGMLISVFELLADSRDQVASVNGYIDALRQFWVASANLQQAMVGSLDETASQGPTPGGMPARAAVH